MNFRSMKYLVVEGLKNVWANRLMSIASVGVLIACMLLMGVAFISSLNIDKMLGTLQDQNVVMVYYKDGFDKAALSTDEMAKIENVKTAKFIPKNVGLDKILKDMGSEFKSYFTYKDGENPLPDAAEVSFKDLSKFDQTILQLKSVVGVDHINDQREVAVKISSIRKLINTAGFWIIGLLMITALVIIANTIRITMHNRKLEISIMKAVGATNNFIRFPFIIEGIVLGLVSAFVTTGLLFFIYRAAINAVTVTMKVSAVPFAAFGWQLLLLFSAIGLLTGCIGSFISLGKYLRKEGSEFRAF